MIFIFLILLFCLVLCYFIYCYKKKPYLWVYWEGVVPEYILLCFQTIHKHCSDFNVVMLNNNNIRNYIPEIDHFPSLQHLQIAQKVDFYRVLLLYKYGGLYIDADTIVMKNPIEIIDRLHTHDYVGFGCTGTKCMYGYGKPSNGIMASRPRGILITRVLQHLISKLATNQTKWNYFDLGKLVIWHELDHLIQSGYTYYHYSNNYDGTRDKFGNWIESSYLLSNKPIEYFDHNKHFFVVLYNSQFDDQFKNLTIQQILDSDINMTTFFEKSLNIK